MRHSRVVTGIVVGAVALVMVAVSVTTRAAGPQVMFTAELADQPLGTFYNRLVSPIDQITDDRGIRLGSLSSDLFHDPSESYNEFWTVTDRGPNGNPSLRTFVVPQFTPLIMHVRVHGTGISVLQAFPILDNANRPVTGLSNVSGFDETPFNYNGTAPLAFNPNGLDLEGIVRMADGSFWLVDEYSPSLVHLTSTGRVAERFVPEDSELASTLATSPNYRVRKNLPQILNTRRQNRGFEGLAVSPDQRSLFIAMQSPLEYPTRALGRASRMVRIFTFDVGLERVTAEYAYEFDEVCAFLGQRTGCGVGPGTSLLVQERTDTATKVYRVELAHATNILGSQWDTQAASPVASTTALETLTNPASQGVTLLPKTLLVDVTALPGIPGKIEGIAMPRNNVLVVGNDNDFGLVDNATFNASGQLTNDTQVKSKLIFIDLATAVN